MKLLFVDVDGTLTETISGHTFKQHPEDVKILPGADAAVKHFSSQGWTIIGVSNQGGVGAGHKSLEAAIAEMQFTLNLFVELGEIYFCPDFEGKEIHLIESHKVDTFADDCPSLPRMFDSFRKPGCGMIQFGIRRHCDTFGNKLPGDSEAWMIGDRPEDEQCAQNAGINFLPADAWRQRFLPGMFEVRNIHPKQIQFLEGIKV